MEFVNELFRTSGLTLSELGRRMGYPDPSARQTAAQFLRTKDPHLSTLRKFAVAMDIPILVLVQKILGISTRKRFIAR